MEFGERMSDGGVFVELKSKNPEQKLKLNYDSPDKKYWDACVGFGA